MRRLSFLLGLLLIPMQSAAFDFVGTINSAGSVLGAWPIGPGGIKEITYSIIDQMRPFIAFIAVLMIMISGYRIIVAQEDEIAGKAKTTISACVSGIILLYLYKPFINAFYGVSGAVWTTNPAAGAGIAVTEVQGLINWSMAIVASLAVTIIIASALRAIATSGSEDGTAALRRTVYSVAAGIFILLLRITINRVLGLTDPRDGISAGFPLPNALVAVEAIIRVIEFVLSFLALIAVISVLYSGVLLVLNLGDVQVAIKSRGIIFRAVIGIIVIGISFALVEYVIRIAPASTG